MCETKAVVVSISLIFLVAASFYIYQAQTENKVGHYSKIKSQGPYEKEYTRYGFNSADCCYVLDEGIVGCNFSQLYGGKRCEMYMWWGQLRI